MGGKPKSTSTSTSSSGSAQDWAQPYASQAAQNVLGVYGANQGGLNSLSQQANSQLGNIRGQQAQIGQQLAGYSRQLGQFGQTAGQGNAFLGDVIGGDYMSGNPYIRNIMGQMGEQILGDVGSGFSSAGRYGSGAYTGVLADSLSDAYGQLLYGNYSDELARRMAATGQAQSALQGQQSAVSAAQQAQAANNQQQLAQTAMTAELPYIGSNNMANSLGALFSGGTEQSQSKQTGPSPIWGALGAGLGAAGSIFMGKSDRRLKTKIELVRRDPDGLGWYEWNWKSDPNGERAFGVIADEVKELRPWAYVPDYKDGYDGVNYGTLNLKIAA